MNKVGTKAKSVYEPSGPISMKQLGVFLLPSR